jgi:signal transduction histidine kinase
MIKSEIERALAMTQDILEFSKGETRLKLSRWNLNSTFEELVNSLSPEFLQHKIRLNFNSAYAGDIVADQYRLMRVFKNLLYNAKEAMTAGGEITIEISEPGQEVLLKFIDNGPGIPNEIKESLFEPFVTHGKVSGTGLGLSISKKIVEEHRGRIEYESFSGRGTTFAIYLPKNLPLSAEHLSLEASLTKP